MKRAMRMIGTGILVASAHCAPRQAPSAPSSDSAAAGISTTGQGEASGAPDLLLANVGVAILRTSLRDAMQEAARRTDAILAAVRALGIAGADVQTTSYSVATEYQDRPPEEGKGPMVRRVVGHRVTHTLTIKIRDMKQAGRVLDSAAAAAGNEATIEALRFVIENDRPLQERARTAAWNDARAKAEQLARLSGVRLGMPLAISESGTVPMPVPLAERSAMVQAAVTPIEPGQLKVSVIVGVRFAIE